MTPIKEIVNELVENLGKIADVNTVVGNPITADGVTLIPVSRVSVGVCSGGSDFDGKAAGQTPIKFGGGAGGGVNVIPVGFIVINEGAVRFISVERQPATAMEKAMDMAPEVINKVTGFVEKAIEKKKAKEEAEAVSEEVK